MADWLDCWNYNMIDNKPIVDHRYHVRGKLTQIEKDICNNWSGCWPTTHQFNWKHFESDLFVLQVVWIAKAGVSRTLTGFRILAKLHGFQDGFQVSGRVSGRVSGFRRISPETWNGIASESWNLKPETWKLLNQNWDDRRERRVVKTIFFLNIRLS